MKLDGNLHTDRLRLRIHNKPGYRAVHLHEAGQSWHLGGITIFVDEPAAFAAWRTLAETLAALDVKEEV